MHGTFRKKCRAKAGNTDGFCSRRRLAHKPLKGQQVEEASSGTRWAQSPLDIDP